MATVVKELGKLSSETASLRKDTNAGFTELRSEMQAGFAGVRSEMAADRAEVVALHRQVTVILTGSMAGVLGLLDVVLAKL
jgi:hypothetical protein